MADSRNGGDAKSKANDSGYDINIDDFVKRLNIFYKCWADEKNELWGGADAVAVFTPPRAEASELRYLKSSALNIWMLGYEFPDTLMVFVQGALHFLCSQKKVKILEELQRPARTSCGVDVVLHVKLRSEDGGPQMLEILDTVKAQSRSPVLGVLAKEKTEGSFMEKWDELLSSSRLEKVDVAAGLCEMFAVKDESEINNVKKAAYLSATAMKTFVVPKLEHVIDEEKRMTHAELMEETENVMLDPPGKLKMKLKAEGADVCYPPIFQSGGVFDLKASAQSNEDPLYYDATAVIICALGGRYNMYCSNVARTYLIDADTSQEKAYKALLKAQEAAINALRPGNLMSAVYKAAATTLEREAPELSSFLTRSAGAGIGIEYRESGLSLNPRNEKVIKAGMVFNVNIGLQNLEIKSSNPKTRTYGLLLADTIVVRDKGPDVVTSLSSKAFQDIAYSFKDGDEEPEERPRSKPASNGAEPVYVKTALRSDNQEMTKEDQRRQMQAELALKKNEETARRLAAGAFGHGEGHNMVKSSGEMTAYRNVDELPFSRELMIQVDQKNEAVLLPIYGIMVPFHIATVRTINNHQDLNSSIIRIIFNVPGAGFTTNDVPFQKFPHMIYLKEISFRTSDIKHSTQIVQMMKTLKRQVSQRESEKAERATLVTQEKLQISKGKAIRLSDLWIRPPFAGRKRRRGTLEAHVNGLRYSTMKAEETVDILYRNIRHAFFQPAEKEMITLLHFHLHNHIMVGNKKAKDVQFFVEVMDGVQNVGGSRRSHFDPDEIEEEQAERERKNKLNKEFEVFVKKVTDLWEQPALRNYGLEFDIPFRELGFHGVPNKTSAFIVPTVKCLVELIEFPFLVVTVEDIELVNLERVGFAQKAFDMAIIFKDFKKDVLRIDAIPSTSLDNIKEWLNSMAIKYYESRMNLNWRPILKTILDDPKKFIDDGGWEFLNMEASDSESEKSEESDKGYEPSDLEEPSESEDEGSDDESVVESEDDEEEEADSDEEEGMSWDELEAKASKEDKEKGDESDSEDERRRRKAKMTGKTRASPKAPPAKRFKTR
ncbi:hypothetical protein SELMODRAFT_269691 [Selaginella moellendorffii]|uniref:FACT complex subunit n=1 Tax=Selaginella moellendorffii TaxID=88036 RepID=D8T4U2_SELML|nr:FACT complex subunit SPT16 [Selaginella moellendorffii]XP_024520160.1 FACT complex subunit SPT16 [Selaginella moellendorffii]EFJ08291.1 hypothetical protein SELMODRAFT_269691 [Selaginella moellendorffii]|eukprot:XP_002990659.1 FACT complex subunit SPT16 [Selaginella moellendorffii]